MSMTIEHANKVHEFLLSPGAYSDRPSCVESKETHISWVYLTDRHVYKRKKPVSFEFLDFSTLQQRKYFCEQEIMLNRRFSPDVYLGVVPISCDDAGEYRLGPGDNVVEWLVKMKRLDEHCTLENLIRDGRLTEEHSRQLSTRLIEFYSSQAPAMLRSSEFAIQLRQHVDANRDDLLMALPTAKDVIQYASNSQLRCLTLEADYFVQRVADGRVVDGHGDLRPEHIYFGRNRPSIIDCVEFHREYRLNDVVDELAFLAMECDRLGDQELGNKLLAAYLNEGTDNPRPFLAEFYKCYRACVRAKIAALRAGQADKAEEGEWLQQSLAYLELARQYAKQVSQPVVILVGGLSGTGKSTLAAALADRTCAALLQTDVLRGTMYGHTSSDNKYSSGGRERVYQAMFDLIPVELGRSPTLILDGTFSSQFDRRAALEKATESDAVVLQVQCECPAREAMTRISQRIACGDGPSEATPQLHRAQAKNYDDVLDDVPAITVDTTQSMPLQLRAVTDRLRLLVRGSSAACGQRQP